jgi:hypothetical protein
MKKDPKVGQIWKTDNPYWPLICVMRVKPPTDIALTYIEGLCLEGHCAGRSGGFGTAGLVRRIPLRKHLTKAALAAEREG